MKGLIFVPYQGHYLLVRSEPGCPLSVVVWAIMAGGDVMFIHAVRRGSVGA